MSNHEFCEECGASDFHTGRPRLKALVEMPASATRVAELERQLKARTAELDAARAEVAESQASFDLHWKASMLAIKAWHDAGNPEMEWPGHSDLCVWLMEKLAAVQPILDAVKKLYGPENKCACIKDMPGDNHTCGAHRRLELYAYGRTE